MRALTLWRPWTWSIVYGPKRIENRPWKPPANIIGQRIALHSGKTYDKDGEAFIMERLNAIGGLPVIAEDQGIVGVATVVGVITTKDAAAHIHSPDGGHQFGWFFGPFGWVLEDVRPIEPIAIKGAQGLWTVPAAIEQQIAKALR